MRKRRQTSPEARQRTRCTQRVVSLLFSLLFSLKNEIQDEEGGERSLRENSSESQEIEPLCDEGKDAKSCNIRN